MTIIQPSASCITEVDPIKKIELIGRTCYKSEDKITDVSAPHFVAGLIQRKHFAMLEHSSVTYLINYEYLVHVADIPFARISYETSGILITLSLSHLFQCDELNPIVADLADVFLMEHPQMQKYFPLRGCKDFPDIRIVHDLHDIPDISQESIELHTDCTIKFICDRGVSHELVRHRCAVAQESTRYCNYSLDKFGGEITYVEPSSWDTWNADTKIQFYTTLSLAEQVYSRMIKLAKLTPQQARAVLPNSLKTEVVLTMSITRWKHFFGLRYFGTTGAPHPDMKKVAEIAFNEFTCWCNTNII